MSQLSHRSGGLSAAVIANNRLGNMSAYERAQALATIVAYPKIISFFKPESMEARGAIAIRGDGAQREILLESWIAQ